ncbi:MAG TPA: zinc ribbon domain-containing protein [Candidatus Binatia bacterium]|nr:zinc ribbon domain-containing protein [Candidatus Binatia bacterium]
MAEVVQGTQQEFWQPPAHRLSDEMAAAQLRSTMAEACPRCGTEFLLGSRFCHTCGGRRPEVISPSARADAAALAGLWERGIHKLQSAIAGLSWSKVKFPAWLHYLQFHEIKTRVGLSTGALIAFVIGLACVAGALLVGLISAKTWNDFYSIQLYRAEWLLAAIACFVAGILLKKRPQDQPKD